VWLWELGKLKKFNDLIRTRTREIPACSTVPQPSTVQRAPYNTVKVKVTLQPIVNWPLCLGFWYPSGTHDHILLLSDSYGFVDVGRPLWRQDGSVVNSCCRTSPAQSSSGPSPVGLATIFYCLKFETRPTSRTRFPYLFPLQEQGSPVIHAGIGSPLWRGVMSVVYSCCWASPAQSFSRPSPVGLTTIFYCLKFETPPTWITRFPFLSPPPPPQRTG
jgi:hypothetical protein